jgi:hypothetical protein
MGGFASPSSPSQGAPGGVWGTNGQGMAQTPMNRPALSGGLQQMQMLNALRGGASMGQLQQMNPYTPRPQQFLPPALGNYSWATDPSNPANAPRPAFSGLNSVYAMPGDGGSSYGDGSASSAAAADAAGSAGGDFGMGVDAGFGEGGGGGGGGGSK